VYTFIERGAGGTQLTRRPLLTNTIFVLFLFIKVAILCSVDTLYYVCYIVLLALFR
jgi:hypothetical protein